MGFALAEFKFARAVFSDRATWLAGWMSGCWVVVRAAVRTAVWAAPPTPRAGETFSGRLTALFVANTCGRGEMPAARAKPVPNPRAPGPHHTKVRQ